MKKLLLILPAVLLLAAGCGSQQTAQNPAPATQSPAVTQNPVTQNPAPDQNQNPPQDLGSGQPPAFNMVKMPLNAQNNSGESGMATIYDVGGKATVVLKVTGEPMQAVQPSHVHVGSCTPLRDVKYPLANVQAGSGKTTLSVSLAELVAQPFAINLHKSATEIGIYVTCGDSLNMVKSISTDPAAEANK